MHFLQYSLLRCKSAPCAYIPTSSRVQVNKSSCHHVLMYVHKSPCPYFPISQSPHDAMSTSTHVLMFSSPHVLMSPTTTTRLFSCTSGCNRQNYHFIMCFRFWFSGEFCLTLLTGHIFAPITTTYLVLNTATNTNLCVCILSILEAEELKILIKEIFDQWQMKNFDTCWSLKIHFCPLVQRYVYC